MCTISFACLPVQFVGHEQVPEISATVVGHRLVVPERFRFPRLRRRGGAGQWRGRREWRSGGWGSSVAGGLRFGHRYIGYKVCMLRIGVTNL